MVHMLGERGGMGLKVKHPGRKTCVLESAGKAGLSCIYALGALVVRSQASKITELT